VVYFNCANFVDASVNAGVSELECIVSDDVVKLECIVSDDVAKSETPLRAAGTEVHTPAPACLADSLLLLAGLLAWLCLFYLFL